MHERALELVMADITSFEEVKRVVPFAELAPDCCEKCGLEVSANFAYCPHCGSKHFAAQIPLETATEQNQHEVLN